MLDAGECGAAVRRVSSAGGWLDDGGGYFSPGGAGEFFTPRECRIAHGLLTEVPWLHAMGWPEDKCAEIAKFSPRIWLVHEMLLQGFSRREIARHLDLSPETVIGYVKEIFE